jgi:hypothetical protein
MELWVISWRTLEGGCGESVSGWQWICWCVTEGNTVLCTLPSPKWKVQKLPVTYTFLWCSLVQNTVQHYCSINTVTYEYATTQPCMLRHCTTYAAHASHIWVCNYVCYVTVQHMQTLEICSQDVALAILHEHLIKDNFKSVFCSSKVSPSLLELRTCSVY